MCYNEKMVIKKGKTYKVDHGIFHVLSINPKTKRFKVIRIMKRNGMWFGIERWTIPHTSFIGAEEIDIKFIEE